MPVSPCFRIEDLVEWWRQATHSDEPGSCARVPVLNPSDEAELAPFEMVDVGHD